MALPQFRTDIVPTREEAVNQVISSIAMQELALSNIVNAEGEKIQFALTGNLKANGIEPTLDEVLQVNDSVKAVLQNVAEAQSHLKDELEKVLSAAVLTGPTGPTGPAGGALEPGYELFSIEGISGSEIAEFDGNLQFDSDTLNITVEPGPVIKIDVQEQTPAGAIIPFASLDSVQTSSEGTSRTKMCAIGFGNSVTYENAVDPIDITGSAQVAFSMPENGTITSLAVYYNLVSGGVADEKTVVTAQLYKSTTPDNIFQPIEDAFIEFEFNGEAPDPQLTLSDSKQLSIEVNANDRLFLAFYTTTPGYIQQAEATAYMGASIKITSR